LTFQRDGVRLATDRTSRLATRKEVEAEGTAGMDSPPENDGRGARMAFEAEGMEGGCAIELYSHSLLWYTRDKDQRDD